MADTSTTVERGGAAHHALILAAMLREEFEEGRLSEKGTAMLGAALARIWPEDRQCVENCPCERDPNLDEDEPKCDECPTESDWRAWDAQLDRWIAANPKAIAAIPCALAAPSPASGGVTAEPVAWAYEYLDGFGNWHFHLGQAKPEDHHFRDIRNIRPLYAHPPVAEPEAGWKLVPVEPTVDILNAGWRALKGVNRTVNPTEIITYRAMLAAAPTPTAGGGETVAGDPSKVRKALLMAREAVAQKVETYRPWADKIAGRINPWQPVLDAVNDALAEAAPLVPAAPREGLGEEIADEIRQWLVRGHMGSEVSPSEIADLADAILALTRDAERETQGVGDGLRRKLKPCPEEANEALCSFPSCNCSYQRLHYPAPVGWPNAHRLFMEPLADWARSLNGKSVSTDKLSELVRLCASIVSPTPDRGEPATDGGGR